VIKRFLAGAALGALFLWYALRDVSFGDLAVNIGRVSLWWFGLFVLMHFGSLGIRALRWSALVRPIAPVPARRLLSPLAIGFMINFVFPARAGEIVRVWLLGRAERVSASAAFGSVVVERLCDVFAILCLVAIAPFFLGGDAPGLLAELWWIAPLLFAGYLAAVAALFMFGHHREALEGFLGRHPFVQRRPLLARLAKLVVKFAEGLTVLKSFRQVAIAIGLSLVLWGWGGLSNLLMLHAFGLDLPMFAPFLILMLQAAAFLVPTPGALGPFQIAHLVALRDIYHRQESEALAIALLIHAGLFVAVLAPGIWFAAREHLGVRELTVASRGEDR
jgi:hypothetical protein